MSKTAAGLLTQLRGQLKDQQERERQARNIERLDIAQVGLTNGAFGIPGSTLEELATNAAGPPSENYSDADRDNDRRLFDPKALEHDGWTKKPNGKWRGPKACPSADIPASDRETDQQSVAELVAGDEAAKQWLDYLTKMAAPEGWQARQDRRTWLLRGRLENALRHPEHLKTLRKLTVGKDRALFEEPMVSDDGWARS